MRLIRTLRRQGRRAKALLGLARRGSLADATRWARAAIARRGQRPVPLTIDGISCCVRATSADLAVMLACLKGEFDDLAELVPADSDGLIVDVGGFIGGATIFFATRFPRARIVAIEPDADNFRMLELNTRRFANVTPINMALAAAPGRIVLRDRGTGAQGFSTVEHPADGTDTARGEVEAITMEEVLALAFADRVLLAKLDVEGAERDILAAGKEWIARTDILCAELHDRIAPGCSDAWCEATAGRTNRKLGGEKYVSIDPAFAAPSAEPVVAG